MRRARLLWLIPALVVGVALYAHFHRFEGGPLDEPGYGAGGRIHVGKSLAFFINFDKAGGGKVTIERVAPLYVTPTADVRIWLLTRDDVGEAAGGPFPPEDTTLSDFRDPVGFITSGRELHLVAEVRARGPGCAGFKGLAIEYRTKWRRYRRTAPYLTFRGLTPHARSCPRAVG